MTVIEFRQHAGPDERWMPGCFDGIIGNAVPMSMRETDDGPVTADLGNATLLAVEVDADGCGATFKVEVPDEGAREGAIGHRSPMSFGFNEPQEVKAPRVIPPAEIEVRWSDAARVAAGATGGSGAPIAIVDGQIVGGGGAGSTYATGSATTGGGGGGWSGHVTGAGRTIQIGPCTHGPGQHPDRPFWFADRLGEDDDGYLASAPRWAAFLQMDGHVASLDIWFTSEEDALAFIRDDVLAATTVCDD